MQLLTTDDVLSVAQKTPQLRRNALRSVVARHCGCGICKLSLLLYVFRPVDVRGSAAVCQASNASRQTSRMQDLEQTINMSQ